MRSKPRVFVTDGSYSHGLAAVRALGRAGYAVGVGERARVAAPAVVAFWSRHCDARFVYPDPRNGTEKTAAALARHFEEHSYDAAIPVSLDMVEVFILHREMLRVPVMLPSAESFRIASDKRFTYPHARSVGVPVPATVPAARWQELSPPIVFKHRRAGAIVARSATEAARFASNAGTAIDEYVAQEYIEGRNGFGYFALFQDGREAAYFMHERLVQYPQDGGPSVVARSIRDERLRILGKELLTSLHWHGPAMVEFKRSDRDGELYLMEINPKLWGSLDLAIAAGCNFPVWIARAVIDGAGPANGAYAEGLTYQWLMPNGLRAFLRYPELRAAFVHNVLRPEVKTDLCWTDPLPTTLGLLSMSVSTIRR
ncbi:MAG: ATP-grasp domain-containing protein [Candidatus Eremiobacteraeota bacterium]|nr:ATP-grasp domain-containing protein [Candidatus Eremiobacteraeota bacterium]